MITARTDTARVRHEMITGRFIAQVLPAVRGFPTSVTASGGVVTTSGERVNPETLIRNADEAMYRAKKAGKNRFEHVEGAKNA